MRELIVWDFGQHICQKLWLYAYFRSKVDQVHSEMLMQNFE
ncbi:hypothetical protein Q671_10815 [Halomonas sp. PBN3]|nr:hypothetical protein Q671_10815 [Halomonas sp. PBN3]